MAKRYYSGYYARRKEDKTTSRDKPHKKHADNAPDFFQGLGAVGGLDIKWEFDQYAEDATIGRTCTDSRAGTNPNEAGTGDRGG